MFLFEKIKKLFGSKKRYVTLRDKSKVWDNVKFTENRSTLYRRQESVYEKLRNQEEWWSSSMEWCKSISRSTVTLQLLTIYYVGTCHSQSLRDTCIFMEFTV